jgi:hypothetical protein
MTLREFVDRLQAEFSPDTEVCVYVDNDPTVKDGYLPVYGWDKDDTRVLLFGGTPEE